MPTFHNPLAPPPNDVEKLSAIPVVHELGEIYLILHRAIRNFQKPERYSLGTMMEKILLECLESCFGATVAPITQKHLYVTKASAQFDALKLYVRIAVKISCLPEHTYVKLIPRLGEVGRMLGGWIAKTQNQNAKS